MQLTIVKISKDIISEDEVYKDALSTGKIPSSGAISPEDFAKLVEEYVEWQNDPKRYIKVAVNASKTKKRLPFKIMGVNGVRCASLGSETLYFNRPEQAIKAYKKILTQTNINNSAFLVLDGEDFTDLAEVKEYEKRLNRR